MTPALKAASTRKRPASCTSSPVYFYPWVVLYRKSLFEEKGSTPSRRPWTSSRALGDKMKADRPSSRLRVRRQGRLAGDGHLRHPQTCGLNGFQFHQDLMAGKAKWTDPKTKARLREVGGDPPLLPGGALRPDLAGTPAKAALVDKIAGMYFLGTFAIEQAGDAADDRRVLPVPILQQRVGLRRRRSTAPTDGFRLSKGAPKNIEAAKGPSQVRWHARGPRRDLRDLPRHRQASPSRRCAIPATTTQRAEDVGRDPQERRQPGPSSLDRDTRGDFAGPVGMRAPSQLPHDPGQDLDKFLVPVSRPTTTRSPRCDVGLA